MSDGGDPRPGPVAGGPAETAAPGDAPAPLAAGSPGFTRLALPFALALVLLSALRWVLADLISPFGWALLAIVTWAGGLLTALAILLSRRAPEGGAPRPATPALLIVLGALLAIYGPWAELDLQARWKLQRGVRERTIDWVRASHPAPGERGRMPLPRELRSASATGGEIRVGRTESDSQAVLFYTYRGVPTGWAGFLHAPSRKPPVAFAGDTLLHVRAMEPGWYFVAAR